MPLLLGAQNGCWRWCAPLRGRGNWLSFVLIPCFGAKATLSLGYAFSTVLNWFVMMSCSCGMLLLHSYGKFNVG